jgi:hypothetical protein
MRNWEFYLAVVRRLTCARPSAACRFNGLVYAKDACESSLLMRPWWPPAPSYAPKYTHGEGAGRKARGIVGSERASRREMSRPGERWPIVLAMRNGEYYLTVVAAPIDRRRIRRPPSSPSFLGLAAIDALYPKRCPKHGKAFASMLAS